MHQIFCTDYFVFVHRLEMLSGLDHREGLVRLRAISKHPAVTAAVGRWTQPHIELDSSQALIAAVQRLRWSTSSNALLHPLESLRFVHFPNGFHPAEELFWGQKLLPQLASSTSLAALDLFNVQPALLHGLLAALTTSTGCNLRVYHINCKGRDMKVELASLSALSRVTELHLTGHPHMNEPTTVDLQPVLEWASQRLSPFALHLHAFQMSNVSFDFWRELICTPHLTALSVRLCRLSEKQAQEVVKCLPRSSNLRRLV
jgi:hypothetical protein